MSAAAASMAGATVVGVVRVEHDVAPVDDGKAFGQREKPNGNALSSASWTDAARIARGPRRQPGR